MRRLCIVDPGFEAEFQTLLQRRDVAPQVGNMVGAIIADLRARGDAALCDYTKRFDRISLSADRLRIPPEEIVQAARGVDPALLAALDQAASRIEAFHRHQLPSDLSIDDPLGLRLGLRWTPLDAVGLYVPGGKASYPSSVLMNALPARVAGVQRLAMCVPTPDGELDPLVLAAAHRAGVSEIYRVGGAQAIAALAFGTGTIAPVDRIVGPGNAYVAEAKRQVFGQVGIDAIAGPSEVVILADASVPAALVAMDLLAQAEHDEAAQAVLITPDPDFAAAVAAAVACALPGLPRAGIAGASWRDHGVIIEVQEWAQAAALVNRLAPEHVQLMMADPHPIFAAIRHAGAVFLGWLTPEALGDYIAGPNHVLPTGGTARFASGLSVFDFLKRTSWIEAGPQGFARLRPAAMALAEAEGLYAHARSMSLRLIDNEG